MFRMSVIKIHYYDNVDVDGEPGQWRQRRQWLGGSNNLGDLPPWTSWLQSSLLSWWLLWSWSWNNMICAEAAVYIYSYLHGDLEGSRGAQLRWDHCYTLHYIKVRGHCPGKGSSRKERGKERSELFPQRTFILAFLHNMSNAFLKGGPKVIQRAN